jgi:hypothetical protein
MCVLAKKLLIEWLAERLVSRLVTALIGKRGCAALLLLKA